MINLVLVDQRIRMVVMDTRVFRGFQLGTDHNLVVARIKGFVRRLSQIHEVIKLGVELPQKSWKFKIH